MIKILIYRLFLYKNVHAVTVWKVDFNDNYLVIQQNFMCHMGSARKRKMHVVLEILHLQHLFLHNSIAECFTKRKTNSIFTIMQRVTTAESIQKPMVCYNNSYD